MQKFFKIFFNTLDLSLSLKSFSTEGAVIPVTTSDFIYIGLDKFFRTFFLEFEVLNTEAASISFEYYDGSAWQSLSVVDETNNFLKSGFINFEPPSTWKKTTINSVDNYYIRMSSDADLTAGMKVKGLAPLFASDDDIIGIRSNIVSKYNQGKAWTAKHEEAKNQIIQRIRNQGRIKVKENSNNQGLFYNTSSLYFDDVDFFDLLKPGQLKEAAKYLAISLIYLNELTDQSDDKFERAGKYYLGLYNEFMNLFMLKIDSNDNGVEDEGESKGDTGINLSWL